MRLSLPAFGFRAAPPATDAHLPRLRSLLARLAHLRLVCASHCHFTQDLLATPPREITICSIYTTTVDSAEHPAFTHMLAIAREQGLDPDWCREQLGEGAHCTLAVLRQDDADCVVGMGMLRTRPFWIEEIRHNFDPGPGGCYLYGLYVSPRFRGRGVQHALAAARLRLALARGCRYAYSLVLNTNRASLKGHAARGAIPSARIDCLHVGPFQLASVRKLKPSLRTGDFLHAGFPKGTSLHLIVG